MCKQKQYNRRRVWVVSFVCLLGHLNPAVAQQGYSIVGGQIVVQQRRHWENWKIPSHLVRIDRAGGVSARTLRSVFNVLEDKTFGRPVQIDSKKPRIMNIDSTMKMDVLGNPLTNTSGQQIFDYLVRPGVSRAGSNPHLAANIADGDPNTFWEPDPDDPLEEWWIEVDLGRVVPLERLRLRFVEEDIGDPFLRFVLLLAAKQNLFLQEGDQLSFESFIPFEGFNTTRREFTFDADRVSPELPPDPLAAADKTLGWGDVPISLTSTAGEGPDPAWTGRLVETIRIVITDARRGRAEQIDEDEWERLPRAERGDIVHFLQDAGYEEPVDAATYASLPQERQGRKEYYRRERPRLAEVEAWGWGDDIGQSLVEGGGSINFTNPVTIPGMLFDGNYGTSVNVQTISPREPGLNVLILDLGGSVWLDHILIVGSTPPRGYAIRGSSGERNAQGDLQWEPITSLERETNVHGGNFRLLVDRLEPARPISFIEMVTLPIRLNATEWVGSMWPRLFNIMLFSKGPPAAVVLESDLIELPGLFTLGAVNWEADAPPGSEVEIRTRSGDQLLERIRYFDKTGNEKTAKEYEETASFFRGPSDTSLVVGPGWSPWSQKYRTRGEIATSPGLRRFVQIQARLLSHDRQAVPALKKITLDLQPPLAQSLGAEVWPERTVAGLLDTFEVFVQPRFLETPFNLRSLGFDEVLLHSEPALDLRLVDAALGTQEELAQGQPILLFARPHAEGLESADGQVLQVLDQGDSLWVHFPQIVHSAEGLTRLYYRAVHPGEEVPTSLGGELLTVHSHAQLPLEERGAVRYFRKVQSGEEVRLEEVGPDTYEDLPPAEQGPIRYFRKVAGVGDQSLFNAQGDTLNAAQHRGLRRNERGWVVGMGRLLRLRFSAVVYLQSTLLKVAVRNSGTESTWQEAQGRDVTVLRPAETLAIGIDEAGSTITAVEIAPNPFTPNGDGVNDVAHIQFALFKIYAARPVIIRLYSLDGRQVRRLESQGVGGRQQFTWDGLDHSGNLVAPGLYLCQIEVEADADVSGRERTHLIAVAY